MMEKRGRGMLVRRAVMYQYLDLAGVLINLGMSFW